MNRFIAEKVMGLEGWYCPVCQRELVPREVTYEEECTVCGCHIVDPDYTTPADYFALLQLAIKKEWFPKLLDYTFNKAFDDAEEGVESFLQSDSSRDTFYTYQVFTYLLAPENFARLVAEYHGWKGEK